MANVYILIVLVSLIAAVLIVFARFSLLFLKKIDEGEEEGKLLRERQKEIVENIMEGLVVHSADGRILSVNKAAEQFFNVQYEGIKGKKVSEIDNPSQLLKAIFTHMEDKREFSFSFTSTGTRFIPHLGQLPGSFFTISGCMGQVYRC